jgi:DNA-binding NarL/FixJ family response regulator
LVIADDHELARSGLRVMLEGEADLRVIGEAVDGLDALELCRRHSPEMVLLDVRMPRLDGLSAARAIRDACPGVRVVMVTMHDSPEYLAEALRAGASGYILKDASRRELLEAVRAVLRGEAFLNGAMTAQVLKALAFHASPARGGGEALTPREREVLALVAQGLSNKEIARNLGISPGTAKVHVERIISKMGVADRTQAAVRAVERGLVADRLG